jgi:ferric-dicitrate binding protein FerR (iron transport regulator)
VSKRDERPVGWSVTESQIDRFAARRPDVRHEANDGEEEEILRSVWAATELPPAPDDWDQLAHRLQAEGAAERRGDVIPFRRVAMWAAPLAAAAAVAALLLVGPERAVVGGAASHPVAVEVPAGETVLVELAEGIEARVAAGSRLSYDRSPAAKEILVTLDGEAYFSVAGGAEHSLLVRTASGDVRDIGTRFNVRARGDRVVVAVEEGAVELSAAGENVRVEAGQRSWAASGQAPESAAPTDLEPHLAWISGRFAMIDEPLEEVFAEIGRRYGTAVQIDSAFRGERLTASMRGGDEHETVQTVCAAVGARCVLAEGIWRVEPISRAVRDRGR